MSKQDTMPMSGPYKALWIATHEIEVPERKILVPRTPRLLTAEEIKLAVAAGRGYVNPA